MVQVYDHAPSPPENPIWMRESLTSARRRFGFTELSSSIVVMTSDSRTFDKSCGYSWVISKGSLPAPMLSAHRASLGGLVSAPQNPVAVPE